MGGTDETLGVGFETGLGEGVANDDSRTHSSRPGSLHKRGGDVVISEEYGLGDTAKTVSDIVNFCEGASVQLPSGPKASLRHVRIDSNHWCFPRPSDVEMEYPVETVGDLRKKNREHLEQVDISSNERAELVATRIYDSVVCPELLGKLWNPLRMKSFLLDRDNDYKSTGLEIDFSRRDEDMNIPSIPPSISNSSQLPYEQAKFDDERARWFDDKVLPLIREKVIQYLLERFDVKAEVRLFNDNFRNFDLDGDILRHREKGKAPEIVSSDDDRICSGPFFCEDMTVERNFESWLKVGLLMFREGDCSLRLKLPPFIPTGIDGSYCKDWKISGGANYGYVSLDVDRKGGTAEDSTDVGITPEVIDHLRDHSFQVLTSLARKFPNHSLYVNQIDIIFNEFIGKLSSPSGEGGHVTEEQVRSAIELAVADFFRKDPEGLEEDASMPIRQIIALRWRKSMLAAFDSIKAPVA